jgi:branched-chain amino acid transport system substrate-binding protein
MGLLVLLVALGVAGGPAAQAGERPAAVKVGATLAVTGPFSPDWGPGVRDFMKLWEKQVNAQGGVFVKEFNAKLPLELVIYDDESNPDKSAELYEKLAAVDKVHLFMGPASSPVTLRATTVAEKLKIPMVTVEANSPVVFSRGFQWTVGVDRPAHYWSEHYFALVKELRDKGKAAYKTIAFLIEDNPHTKDVAQGAQDYAQKAGFQSVAAETVPFRTKDFSAAIARFKSLNPDIVYVAAWPFTSAPFFKQAHELGLKPKEMHTIHLIQEWARDVGPQLAEGVTGETHVGLKAMPEGLTAILKEMKIDDPYSFKAISTPIRYLGMETIRRGVEAAGTLDRERLMATLRALQFDMPWGPAKFNFNVQLAGRTLNGVGEKYLFASQIQGGRIRALAPARYADAEYRPSPRQ